ncbi:MAG: fatty acid desaturase [Alphaproteobacteria bacterium]|nr:fatty acid desaturase [Alphaproteobacteria bacterium]
MLRHAADARAVLFVLVALGLQLGGFVLWPVMPGWVAALWVAVACWFGWITAVITHNIVHVPVFVHRPANRAMQLLLTVTYGHPVSAFVPGHNLSHHVHTQTRKDVMRTTKLRFRWNFLNGALAPLVLARDITRSDLAYATAMRRERPRWFRQWVLEYAVFGITQLALILISPVAWVLFVFLPHNAGAFGIIGMNFLQHDGCDAGSRWNHSRNFVGPLINWWTFNNGFHTIHHLHPGMHWTLLREAHAREVVPHIHPALDEPNLFAYTFRALVWPGRRLDYLGRPVVLPEEGPDESWIPGRGDTPAEVSLGAEA